LVALTTPDWLARHDCKLEVEANGQSYLVLLANKPQYLLVPIPLGDQFGCAVTQTINGRRLDGNGTYPSPEDAVRGGLEDLRKALGW
jgi:hypothetical protein